MALKIVRNDITRMQADIIVNTANDHPTVGTGCDRAVYQAAGYDELLAYRKTIGFVPEGDAFITPAFKLQAKYIVHAVSPLFIDGQHGEEEKLRSCYRKSLALAAAHDAASIAFPLISTGGFGYPREEGLRIAVDEISAFLLSHEMLVYLVVFDEKMTSLGTHLFEGLDAYIDQNYVEEKQIEEYDLYGSVPGWAPARPQMAKQSAAPVSDGAAMPPQHHAREKRKQGILEEIRRKVRRDDIKADNMAPAAMPAKPAAMPPEPEADYEEEAELSAASISFSEDHESELNERIKHLTDTFSEYLIYLIDSKHMAYPDVYKRAIVDKKVFSKIKNNPDAHPKKMTVMCLCVGAMLNLDETKDLMARAGYALSPCDKTDIIFSYFIENKIYDMIELDIQLEEHGLPCLIA